MVYDNKWPHVFRGRALYQLNLVKVAEARKFVPQDLPLVELFGYTLGGLYLARYEDSPAGKFDEMVALAGLVWNPPTSCAWAAKVYVSSPDARLHGVKEVGLPSHLARFTQGATATSVAGSAVGGSSPASLGPPCWWRHPRKPAKWESLGSGSVAILADDGAAVCTLALPAPAPARGPGGPRISMKLPSFSGRTASQPALLRYALDLSATVRLCAPARVLSPGGAEKGQGGADGHKLAGVLGGRPLLTIAFDDMEMLVGQPTVVPAAVPAGGLVTTQVVSLSKKV